MTTAERSGNNLSLNQMTTKEAENRIKQVGGDVKVFWNWMRGQTCGLNEDGTNDIYEYDVERFVRYKCDPKNEPLHEVD
uniref:Uncharacterized protein n=1 Tax=viral metagenome TaxID=1070528 RepID=A0A6M3J8G4_9ZZZZ